MLMSSTTLQINDRAMDAARQTKAA